MIKNVLQKLTVQKDLTAEEAYSLIVAIKNDELSDVQIAGFQVALLMKGPTLTEITAIAQAMRDNCIKIGRSRSTCYFSCNRSGTFWRLVGIATADCTGYFCTDSA
ncbi:MAG: hypothetical protein PHD60_08415 [Clostridia bacterium]|nr:hypothetical protein [Clostridia bacterium]